MEKLYIRLLKDIKGEHLKKNDLGKIQYTDDIGQIHVDWEKRSGLAIIPQIDSYQILKPLRVSLDYDDFLVFSMDNLGLIIDLSDGNKVHLGEETFKEGGSDYFGEEFYSEKMIGYNIIEKDLDYITDDGVKTLKLKDKILIIYNKPYIRAFMVCNKNKL